ncbi:tRNA (adenosine(37)-N6)-threonylcarbamoyltransferase complex dimerization subunit type 1 TsaB [Thiomicrospira microaerophila]|uniref:tRNA (adenosine(37)-N6)-threonylcarbamoyltransferase complex dimerization subunit type 1 TsaB n=1 Tax=Thiomicrospira microaerophila TaxID=406020 RepID=UPI0005C8F96D|nr:tRNA (adenosine(37)-N6)-threonylcarbamoyltransferase complex dimerization subunit type 1 TsaB [Thiomicrospira microaerophila]
MNVLAIETSTANCAVSLVGEQVCVSLQEYAPQQHAQLILPMVDQVLSQAGFQAQDIDALAFGEGPGAFTGLRIAAGVVQGLALGWDKPVIAVSSLQAMAYQAFEQTGQTHWLACLDARMGEVYTQWCEFDTQGQLLNCSTAQLVKAAMINPASDCNGVGDIQTSYPAQAALFSRWLDAVPNANAIAQLARQRPAQAYSLGQQIPQPIYLRPSVS